MQQIHGFDFFPLRYDENGRLENPSELTSLQQRAGTTDVLFLAHGFRNNEQDAMRWYKDYLQNFRQHVMSPKFAGNLEKRNWAIAGVFWPSKAVPEGPSGDDEGATKSLAGDREAQKAFIRSKLVQLREDVRPEVKGRIDEAIALLDEVEGDEDKQDEFVEKLLSAVDSGTVDENEGLGFLRSMEGSEVLDRMSPRKRRRRRSASDEDEDEGGTSSVGTTATLSEEEDGGAALGLGSFFGGVFGRIGQLINLTTWYVMKERSGTVGASGVADAVRALKKNSAVKVHLVGHSLGGRLMAACSKALAVDPMVQPDSLVLLQAAFSHYGFSKKRDTRPEGFFRSVVDRKVVKGPLVVTFSSLDDVVGRVYSIASMLRGDNVKKLGDKDSQFGGIGANGAQQFESGEVVFEELLQAGSTYTSIKPGVVACLDGSKKLITSHGDITNANVTYACASAIALT